MMPEKKRRVVYRLSPRPKAHAVKRGGRTPLIPFNNLIDFIEAGYPLSEFLAHFPTVSHDLGVQALEEAKESLLATIA